MWFGVAADEKIRCSSQPPGHGVQEVSNAFISICRVCCTQKVRH